MIKRILLFACLLAVLTATLLSPAFGQAAAPAASRAKLLLVVVVDQFRYDYLTRFRPQYTQGFDRLLTRGAVFTNAFLDHYPTVTAIGHSTVLTGATPAMSGIVGNEWFDRESGKEVTSVSDPATQLLCGAAGKAGSSPHRLLVSTVGDEMKMSGRAPVKVVGVSLKDRAAILPSGHMADGAYWFDAGSGNFASSTFYFAELPEWVRKFNAARPADRYLGASWTPVENASRKPFKVMPATADGAFYAGLASTPYGNELVEQFAESAFDSEQLGKHEWTDVLTVSFSSNDYVGHAVGPDSPLVRDISIRTDRILGRLFDHIDQTVGMDNVLVVFTADHGVSPVPELMQQRKMPGGRMNEKALVDAMAQAIVARYGEGEWFSVKSGSSPYLNLALIREKKLDPAEVRKVAAAALAAVPHVNRVYTWDQLQQGQVLQDEVGRRLQNGFHAGRASDLFVVFDPYWMESAHGTTHGQPYRYDTHVPVILMGPGIRAGAYHQTIRPNDIAPTLATIFSVETPSGSIGRVLGEIFAQ